MRVLIIVASARQGSSQFIADQIQDVIGDLNCEVIRLSEYKIGYCRGCLECDETHECNIQDDMKYILDQVRDADVIIMVSPTRYSLLSGDAKVFIDRLNPTAVSGDIEGKKFIAITIGQTNQYEEVDSVRLAVDSLAAFADNAGMEIIGKYCVYNCYGVKDIYNQENIVKEIAQDIIQKI